MGWFSKLIGADNAIEAVDNFAKSGMTILDEAFDTDEEKRASRDKIIDSWVRLQETINTQKSPTSVSRRVVAGVVLSLIWVLVMVSVYLLLGSEQVIRSDGLVVLSNEAKLTALVNIAVAFKIGWAFCTIIVFYFGPHLLGKLKGVGNVSGGA